MKKKPKPEGTLEPVQMHTGDGMRTVAWRGQGTRLRLTCEDGREFQVVIVARNDEEVAVAARRLVGEVFETEKVGEIICVEPRFFDQRVKL